MRLSVGSCAILATLAVAALARPARADPDGRHGIVTASVGLYTYHLSSNPEYEYNSWPWMASLEWEGPTRWAVGGAFFENSFYEPCGYVYGQRRYTWGPEDDSFFLKITAGLIYGYKPPYDHAVPIDIGGVNPALIPIVGYKYGRFSVQFVVFGLFYGVVFGGGYDIWR